MATRYGRIGGGIFSSQMFYHIVLLLLLQYFFKFAQGQGPGFNISENRPPGTFVGQISTQPSHVYTFSEDSEAKTYFNLDSQTGEITTKVTIDRESLHLKENQFNILILAQSSSQPGSGSYPVEISITVLDENDNNPMFPSSSINITFRENSQVGSQQYISTASDLDIGPNARISRYLIIAGDGPFELVFDPVFYGDVLIIQTTGKLDREINSSYTFTVLAKDQGSPQRSGSTTVHIMISDENDNPPTFDPSSYYANVNETDRNGTFVVKVKASDPDIGINQDITYQIVDGNLETNQFKIEKNTGEIFTTTVPLFCKDRGICLLTVEARDGGMPSYTGRAFVYITVLDTNNHNPVIEFKFVPEGNTEFSSINEDAKDGDIAAGILTSDADDGIYGQTNARIISGNELKHFRFESFPGTAYFFIRVNGDSVLDRERHNLYNLSVEAKDNGNPPRTTRKSLIIYVNDINDHAPLYVNNKVSLSISEITQVGSFIASMLATDLDTGINAKLTYRIESGNDPEWFQIDQQTGLVTTKSKLHYNQRNYFKMNISVHDGALNPLTDYAVLTITIWDENDMVPTFSQSVFNVSLDENLVSGAPVVSASAFDYDSGSNGTVSYEFHPHVQLLYPDTFHLDTSSGSVTTRKPLDREEIKNYVIKIIAKDHGVLPLSSTATVYLKVNDVNDNSPVFYPEKYHAKIIEGQGQEVEVSKVTATDLDEGVNAEIIYSIDSSNNKFTINSTTGSLKATKLLRKDEQSSYTLSIIARDQFGQMSATAAVTISVISPQDPQPYFNSQAYTFRIPEDPGTSATPPYIGSNVGKVTANSQKVEYEIVDGDQTRIFSVDSTTGWIRRSKAIDREMFPMFQLKVVAVVGDLFAETLVSIVILDDNDNAPKFDFPFLDIDLSENWPVGHYITIISASDPDETGSNSRIAYSLQMDQNNMFGIESDTGLLFLRKPVIMLGSNSITLNVVAVDSGTPQLTANQELRLKVKDVNNHTPRFSHTTYEMSLLESQAVSSRFFDVGAIDEDMGENGKLIYNITRGNEDEKFGIFPDGYLFIAKELDRETKNLYKLGVMARDNGTPSRSSECNITVHITDYNDNKPIFLNATYSFGVSENKSPGTYVGHVKASDDDIGRNAELSYYLWANETNFKIDSQTGEVVSLISFDRELLAISDYTLTFDVTVKDNGLIRLVDIATIRVTILDENDNAPKFRQPIYKVSVFENAPPYSNITVVRADDLDSGINNIVTYAITSGNNDGIFVIGQTSGQITLNKALDRETVDYYELTVVGRDSGATVRHSATAIVKIYVNDINDNFPLFAQSHLDISVAEDREPGSMVAYFPATDTDLGVNGEITYSMSGVDHDQTFGIDRHTGKIYLEKKLDYEIKKSYRLNVTATDNGVPPLSYYIRFSITIDDVNDNYPIFQNEPLTFHIREGASGSVSEVNAVDLDSEKNGEVQYHIAYQEPTGDNFKIVKNTGQIYIDKQIDREETDMYTLTVVATDQAEDATKRLSTETRIVIYIDDINDNDPLVTSFSAMAIPLSTPMNEFVTTITASDKDQGENGRISLTLLQNSGSNFGLETGTGRFYLNKALPTTPFKYDLAIQAKDYGTPTQRTSQATLTVIVVASSNNEGPIFQSNSYRGSVSENSVAGKSILRVQANSLKNSVVEYYVTNITLTNSGKSVERIYEVDKSSGVLSTAKMLDRDKFDGDTFDVEIYAIDSNGDQSRTSFVKAQVQLTDANDTPPKFSKDFYSVDVSEDVRPDFSVIKVTAYDKDSFGVFQLTLDSGINLNLKINQDGWIVTTGQLDREVQSRNTVRVTATDGVQSSTCMVRINLLDVNDNAPRFTLPFYSFDINEDTAIGTTVGSIRAHDSDEGKNGEVTYSLSSGWGNETFDLDPVKGTFTLRRVVHFEENQLYTLVASAKDRGDPAQTRTVIVYFNVRDTNNNMPQFSHGTYNSAIYENVTMGTSVIQVLALDVDAGVNGQVVYSIPDGDLDNQFRIDTTHGAIYTTDRKLDRETTANYSLIVMATDMATHAHNRKSATAEVLITILDVNDFTPVILAPPIIYVQENTALNTVVHTIPVRDLDEGMNSRVEFSISSPSGAIPFTLGISDGKLRVNTDLDRESVQNYTMVVVVKDKGSPSLMATQTLIIKIADVNDHSPVFSPEFYDKTVTEDVQIGTTLLQVSATDRDADLNGIVRYFLISGDNNYDFSMDQSSGVIRVQKGLDYERAIQYSLIIQAEDSGDDTRYSTATVSITVQNVNDNVPLFFDSPYIGYVRENMDTLPVHVLQVSARDDDSAQLNYGIREGNTELFNISSMTGEILALKKLDREEKGEYVLTVIATDSATGRGLTGTGTVSVFVEDVNDNPPIFEDVGTYVAHILENSPVNSEVIVVKATDADEGVNSQIIYSLSDSINNKFTIFPDTGRISTRAQLDREEMDSYMLVVIAKDASMLPQSSTTTVMVYIDDENDNPPVFDKQSYTQTVILPVNTGAFVLGVTALDADIGNNSLVTYSLSETDSVFFSVNTQTGVVTVQTPLTSGRTYIFRVTATDKGSQSKSSIVPVTVTTSSGSGIILPTFNQVPSNLNISENLQLNKTVTKVTAQASNSAAEITYSIVGGNIGQAFGIVGDTGSIYVIGVIDYEVAHEYRLWIKASQSGGTIVSQFAEVVIHVQDVNDNKPRFSETLYNVSVDENVFFGSTVVTVTATDADSGNNSLVSYSLSGADSSLFKIDSKSGEILTYTKLDRERIDMYNLVVIAMDSGTTRMTSSASVRINVLDLNDESPAFTRQFRVKIPENTNVGSFIVQVTSSDKDIGENAIATYSLTDDADGMFMIDGRSGNITLRKPLNAEIQSTYTLRVSATDNGAHNVQANVEIDVSDVNDNDPVITEPLSFSFAEMETVGSFVGQLHATDNDISAPNNQVYFSLKLASSYFHLDSDTGKITSLDKLTFDPARDPTSPPNRHELIVIAKDLGIPVRSSEKTVFVNVVDYNDHAPVFEQTSYRTAVPETAEIGDSILQVVARDEYDFGENAQVEYFLSGGNGTSLFSVDRFLGKISVASSLVGNRNKEYAINIKAQDKGTHPQSSVVSVNLVVTDNNIYAPKFIAPASKQITIPEDKTVGSLIETFLANDADYGLNAEVIYNITGGNENDLFEMDKNNGKLSVKRELDYERAHDYPLSITARDKGLYFKETTVQYLVKLSDVNDNDPVFAQTEDIIFVAENTPKAKSVYHAVAVDIDSNENTVISYAIVGNAAAQFKFKIDINTGVVTVSGDLDYETTESYSLTIMALNPDNIHKSTMSLTINIEGVNEYVPEFKQDTYYFSISESAETKTSVGQVLATDNDTGQDGIVNYFLIGDSNAKGFKVDPRTGIIYVSGQPDYESSPSIMLEVLAKNWGSVKGNDTDTCVVRISVQDANDPPVFKQQLYQAHILENSTADISITTVIAEDFDYEPSDRIFSYVILAGNTDNLFKINSNTGYVQTTGLRAFDREATPMYNVTVAAVDTGSPPETGSATVQIILTDVNDNGPNFINFTAKVAEGQIAGTLVTTLNRFTIDPDDNDLGNQGPYTYRKVPGMHLEYDFFDINEKTGNVTTKKALDRESIAEFLVPVIVGDGGSPTMSSTLTFKISVSDLNDTPPTQRFMTVFVSLYMDKYPRERIADVKPLDRDISGRYECDLHPSTSIPFSITSDTCDLMMTEYPTSNSYNFEISGSDRAFPAVKYDVSVKISVFNNNTLDHSTIVQIAGVSADDFMSNSYTIFLSSVRGLFDSQDEVFVFGLMQQNTSGNLLIFLAVKQSGQDQYYSSDFLNQKISAAKNTIQSNAGIFILDIAYSTCRASSVCKNNGQCASHVTVSTTNQIADSPYQAFSNPMLSIEAYCICPPQFTGPDCSQPASQCGSTYCQNGGSCVSSGSGNVCQCPSTWTGSSCELDVNECAKNVCQNEASCENLQGSFICHCRNGFSDIYCQVGFDYCMSNPCGNGVCKNIEGGFVCECPYGYWGKKCEQSSQGFYIGSYKEFTQLTELNNEIEVIFATQQKNALLLYNPSSVPNSPAFIALEILNGRIRFSISLGTGAETRVTIDKMVNTGEWYKVTVNRNRDTSKVWVETCPQNGGLCTECQIGTSCYGIGQTNTNGIGKLEVGTHPLSIGGIKDINTIANRLGMGQVSSHDFVGCIRSFIINGQDKLGEVPTAESGVSNTCPRTSNDDVCQNYACKNGGTCVAELTPVCQCTEKFFGSHCDEELKPFNFGPDRLVKFIPKESARRDELIGGTSSSRRRRAVSESNILVRFRMTSSEGIILFASTIGGSSSSKYSALSVMDGKLKFTIRQFGTSESITMNTLAVSDGAWHNASVTVSASGIRLILDGVHEVASSSNTFLFNSLLDVKELTLGGAPTTITIDNKSLKDFDGCISVFQLDGKALPMNGTTNLYKVEIVGAVENGCSSLCANNACDGGGCKVEGEAVVCAVAGSDGALSIGIIVVIVFFILLIIVIIVVFIVFRQRRKLCMKGKDNTKQNGNTLTKSADSSGHSHQDSGYSENNIDELIIRNHIARELAESKFQSHPNGRLRAPDIIESEMSRTPMPLEIEDGTVIIDNASDLTHLRDLNGEMPEHYDLENASSIAPSDIDVVDHYRHFHDGGRQRRKNKAHSNHSHNNSQHSSKHYNGNYSNQSSHNNSHVMRDSPNLLTSVPYMNDLARGSQNTRNSPINQLSRNSPNVRQSPLTHVNMQGHGMPVTDLNNGSRTTSEHSLASHRSKNSGSTPNKPKRQMLPNGHPANARKISNNYENKFLTVEEVDRLNSRPHESPASMMEAFSTSSENNTRKMKKPFESYQDTSVLLEPPESSSDDSANDSFTCSEFEYENEKQRSDFDPNSRIFSNLTEVENETEDGGAYHNKNFKLDGLDSGGNSFSSNVGSSDESQSKLKPLNNAFNWDDLLNWGPKFEKLVGVFTDIALLPDADNMDFAEVEGKMTDREEYV